MIRFIPCALLLMPVLLSVPAVQAEPWSQFAELPLWKDGLCEMSYYDATDTIYGQQRRYTRVHLLNRQFMGATSGVKAAESDADAVPAFKLNIAEEIPTENYNYRYLTTVFLRRPDLAPFKIAASSQEWCGTTFKHLRWGDEGATLQTFSYFGGEGDRTWTLPADAVPPEALFVYARAAVAAKENREISLLPAIRGTHAQEIQASPAQLSVEPESKRLRTPAGTFSVQRVQVRRGAETAWFEVETAVPYRLVAFSANGVEGRLRLVERRAYWDRNWKSGFHDAGEAP